MKRHYLSVATLAVLMTLLPAITFAMESRILAIPDLTTGMLGILAVITFVVAYGVVSSVIDNIPIMYAVLSMGPDMSHGQWLLVTLTAGVGGSLLSIGSAAGVGLMGQARGIYTFFSHLKWTWAVALGYAASIWAHFLINRSLF